MAFVAINGGFGLVLDGSDDAAKRAKEMLHWDVLNGVSRRAWGFNENAEFTIKKAMEREPKLRITMPNHVEDNVLDKVVKH